jgi:hypothetical protein
MPTFYSSAHRDYVAEPQVCPVLAVVVVVPEGDAVFVHELRHRKRRLPVGGSGTSQRRRATRATGTGLPLRPAF